MYMYQIYQLRHVLLCIVELILVGWSIRLWRQSNKLAIIILQIVLASLVYDNFVLAIGALLGPGELLMYLNKIRFLVHYISLPFLIVVGVDLVRSAGAAWATPLTQRLSWVLAFCLAILDVLNRYVGMKLELTSSGGIVRYTALNVGIPIITIAVSVFILLIGIGIQVRSRGKLPWLFIGALVALLGNALPQSLFGTLPASSSEFMLILSLLVTERYTSASPSSYSHRIENSQ